MSAILYLQLAILSKNILHGVNEWLELKNMDYLAFKNMDHLAFKKHGFGIQMLTLLRPTSKEILVFNTSSFLMATELKLFHGYTTNFQ